MFFMHVPEFVSIFWYWVQNDNTFQNALCLNTMLRISATMRQYFSKHSRLKTLPCVITDGTRHQIMALSIKT